jgi:hypothetical protein
LDKDYPQRSGVFVPATALDERYGRTPALSRRRRTIAIVVAGAFALVFGAWLLWAGLLGDGAAIEFRDVGHEIVDDSLVTVSWQVTVEPNTPVGCAVEALNESFSVVGWKVLDIPASAERTRTFTEEVRTSELAVSGLIYRCWLA